MTTFVLGQRWVVDSEPDLGLGIVVGTEDRAVDIYFDSGACERRYAIEQAPLTRIVFDEGDTLTLTDDTEHLITKVLEQDGLVIYQVSDDSLIPETKLSSKIQLNQPFMRLMTGQIDKPNWFYFRRELDAAIANTWQSRLNGLLGARATLIPHQLYIAWSACEREKVRVLLADEVGLGKTIEAGMILMRLLKSERVHRVLIAVPDALQVQWLVELVRKFDLTPELYAGEEHNFDSGQIHIIPHSALATEADRLNESEFDITVVDEAHHISPDTEEFVSLQSLSDQSPHLVLLTATPEQLGIENHFARLQLLDKDKFTNLEEFKALEANYAKLNRRMNDLPKGLEQLIKDYDLDYEPTDEETTEGSSEGTDTDFESIKAQLLDRHGIGRVVFRNVRKAISGFPKRIAHPVLLNDDEWSTKFEWLSQFAKELPKSKKLLVICHSIDHVFECEQYLWKKHGMDSAVFHEEQTLIERDKSAAYFADEEFGSQILICSEIGSEGRNFQFSHHLVCLDIPEHPDLLEQRIGRLDRIGQKNDVNIHLLIAEGSHSQDQFTWFHETLECVETLNPAAGATHEEFWPLYLASGDKETIKEQALKVQQTLRSDIEKGRDALLEMNSCRQPFADQLAEKINEFEQNSPFDLVELASELLNFHFEETVSGAYSLIPSDKMLIPALPGIPPDGCEITFSREIANSREDFKFISWDSPFIQGLWELLHHSEIGSASVAMFKTKQLPAGHCLLEACFDLSVQSLHSAAARPFLNSVSIRSLTLDISDKDLSQALKESSLQSNISSVKKHLARQIIKARKDDIPKWFKKNELFAENQKNILITSAKKSAEKFYNEEISRLEKLAKVAEDIDEKEIASLKEKKDGVINALNDSTQLQLSAIRLIVISDS